LLRSAPIVAPAFALSEQRDEPQGFGYRLNQGVVGSNPTRFVNMGR
jgi:hypothetical protein